MSVTNAHKIEAEIPQLIHIIINSLYSEKEIFLRELISNASDAIEKRKYLTLSDEKYKSSDITEHNIQVIPDKQNKLLIIRDTGIGMTSDELRVNLGTIAKSGTRNFIQEILSSDDKTRSNLIGQFGMGFYSSFLIGNKVVVKSRHPTSTRPYVWTLDMENSSDSFTISESDDVDFSIGTEITIYVKDDSLKFLEESVLKNIIKKHSDYINYPIHMMVEKTVEEDANDDANEDNDEDPKIEEVKDDTKTPTKTTKTIKEFDTINSQQPLWRMNTTDITPEMYSEFYKNYCTINKKTSTDFHFNIHFRIEGREDFTCLFFVPKEENQNQMQSQSIDKDSQIQLFVKRVYINKYDKFLPKYLNFIMGIVDSDDVKLNVSRELLQNNSALKSMSKHILKKIFEHFVNLANTDSEKYLAFYKQYFKFLKMGYHEEKDEGIREKIASLFRYNSLKHKGSDQISFDKYISEAKDQDKKIYYMTGDNVKTMENSVFLQWFKKKDLDVIFMDDNIDEYVMSQLKKLGEYVFVNITKENCKLDDEELFSKELVSQYEPLCTHLSKQLGGKLTKVGVCQKYLEDSVVGIIVSTEYAPSAQMEKMQKYQALSDKNNFMLNFMKRMKNLELNPNNQLVKQILKLHQDNEVSRVNSLGWILYCTAMINSGFEISTEIDEKTNTSDMQKYAQYVVNIISEHNGLNINESDKVDFDTIAADNMGMGMDDDSHTHDEDPFDQPPELEQSQESDLTPQVTTSTLDQDQVQVTTQDE